MSQLKYTILYFVFIMFFIQLSNAQDSIRVTTNAEGNQEYILSEDKYDNVLKMAIQYDIMRRRFELLNEQVSLLSQKSILADSAQTIQSLEAKFWYEKLHQNDKLLEEERIRSASMWNSKTFWFSIGALTASVVYLAK
jgi:hypothetical protein